MGRTHSREDNGTVGSPVAIVTPDVALNCLGRALVLAELLVGEVDVRIVGVRLGASVWAPARSSPIPLHDLPVRHVGDYPRARRFLRRQLAGRRVIVSKARPTSMGLALASGVKPGSMLLDIDDWEVGFRVGRQGSLFDRVWRRANDAAELVAPRRLNSYASEVALDLAARRFPHVLVSNQWLANRFGGRILPHVRDTSFLDPARVDVEAARHELGMSGRPWVGFIGTVRQHKGVEVLLDALDRVGGDPAPGLYVAGADDNDAFVRSFTETAKRRLGADRVRIVGQFDFELLPRRVAVADVICIPSLDDPAAWGQIPAKLFDAMAMAKPVIASRVNDLEAVLDGCGRVVTPGDAAALAARIEELCTSRALRHQLGASARERAVARYSHAAGRQTLLTALSEVQPFAPRESAE